MTDISYYLDQPYTKILRRDEDGDIVATIEELDGCITHGNSEAEALQNLKEAQVAWIEAALGAGQEIPVPEPEEELPSGKFVVRLPRSLHLRLNKLAKKDDVSLNQLVVMAATEYVTRHETRAAYSMLQAWRPKTAKWTTGTPAKIGEYLDKLKESGAEASETNDPHMLQVAVRTRRKG